MRPSPRPASAGRRSTICIGTTRERPATDSPFPASPSQRRKEEFEPKKAKKQKGSRGPGFFSKIKEKMINMFDEEIDDNEI